jgi:hypothetical protein
VDYFFSAMIALNGWAHKSWGEENLFLRCAKTVRAADAKTAIFVTLPPSAVPALPACLAGRKVRRLNHSLASIPLFRPPAAAGKKGWDVEALACELLHPRDKLAGVVSASVDVALQAAEMFPIFNRAP